jgi:hypothetical protein
VGGGPAELSSRSVRGPPQGLRSLTCLVMPAGVRTENDYQIAPSLRIGKVRCGLVAVTWLNSQASVFCPSGFRGGTLTLDHRVGRDRGLGKPTGASVHE